MRLISAEDVASTMFTAAMDALEAALLAGFDPENDAPRSTMSTAAGEILLMPSTLGTFSGVKLLSSTQGNSARHLPLIQGAFVLFEGPGQRPAAIIDGSALTNLRTPAVSALAVRRLAPAPAAPERLTVFGTGPQARGHALALCESRDIAQVALVGRNPRAAEEIAADIAETGTPTAVHALDDCAEAVAQADIICTCTSASTPLFDGTLVKDDAVVVAMGSHHPDARETDDALVTRSKVVVESRTSTLREGGDVVVPINTGVLDAAEILTLADVVTGRAALPATGPRLFKGTGMPWEDLVVAVQIYQPSNTKEHPGSATARWLSTDRAVTGERGLEHPFAAGHRRQHPV